MVWGLGKEFLVDIPATRIFGAEHQEGDTNGGQGTSQDREMQCFFGANRKPVGAWYSAQSTRAETAFERNEE